MKLCNCGRELNKDGVCDSSNYPPDLTISCKKCGDCFNPDVSGTTDKICDTCYLEIKN